MKYSTSHVGECYDNVVVEQHYWLLKHEWTKHKSFVDLEATILGALQ